MPIFARRTLQRMISENDAFLTKAQTEKHVSYLNKADEFSIAYEWEVVVLNALSKIGCVSHEEQFGSKLPDIHFKSRSTPSDTFIADITAVSDEGQASERFKTAFTKL